MLSLLMRWFLANERQIYYVLSIASLVVGLLIIFTRFNLYVSLFIFAMSGVLWLMFSMTQHSKAPKHLARNENNLTINTQGGHHIGTVGRDYVQGDYIKMQGVTININQDLSVITEEIKTILAQLENRGYSSQAAQQEVADDLAEAALQNDLIKRNLMRWMKINPSAYRGDTVDLATEFIKRISDVSPFDSSAFVDKSKYRKLRIFLKAGKWKEADEETVKLICKLMPEGRYGHSVSVNVRQIPRKDLRKLNDLWLKYSGGRFGFSVQQRIWKGLEKAYSHREQRYKAFYECVGWEVERAYLYHTDLVYSLKAPLGHLPAKIMLYGFNPSYSNYSYINQWLFEKFMRQEYHKTPFIPSWLRALLVLD